MVLRGMYANRIKTYFPTIVFTDYGVWPYITDATNAEHPQLFTKYPSMTMQSANVDGIVNAVVIP